MIKYEKIRSTEKPETMVIDEYSVWLHENINEVEVEDIVIFEEETEEIRTHIEYEFDIIQYEKNEYILSQAQQITDTELALCEIYESLGV